MESKQVRRRKYYLHWDLESATLPLFPNKTHHRCPSFRILTRRLQGRIEASSRIYPNYYGQDCYSITLATNCSIPTSLIKILLFKNKKMTSCSKTSTKMLYISLSPKLCCLALECSSVQSEVFLCTSYGSLPLPSLPFICTIPATFHTVDHCYFCLLFSLHACDYSLIIAFRASLFIVRLSRCFWCPIAVRVTSRCCTTRVRDDFNRNYVNPIDLYTPFLKRSTSI